MLDLPLRQLPETPLARNPTYVEGECIALQEQSQISVLAQCGVVGDLRDALFQRKSSLSEELVFEPAKCVLLGDWRYDDPRVVMAERFV